MYEIEINGLLINLFILFATSINKIDFILNHNVFDFLLIKLHKSIFAKEILHLYIKTMFETFEISFIKAFTSLLLCRSE